MGAFTQPELTPKPVLEPSSFDVLRDLYSSKLVNQEANPYGFDPSKGQSQASLWTGNGRGTFDPMSGNYGPNPGSYPNPGSMAGPSMGGAGGGQGGGYGFGGGSPMGGGMDPSRQALMAYIMELMKGSGGMGGLQPRTVGPRPMGNDGYTLNGQITNQGNFDGCAIGHDAAPAQPPQVDPANFSNPAGVQNWLNMNPGNHGAFGTTPHHTDPNNPFGMGGGGGGNMQATPQRQSAPTQPMGRVSAPVPHEGFNQTAPGGGSNPGAWGPAPPIGPGLRIPNAGGWGQATPPLRPIGTDSPYMFQRGPMAPLGMDAFPGQPGAGGNGFVGFAGGGQAPLGGSGGGIQALIQALMGGGGGGGPMGGGGMGMMRRRPQPMGMR